MTTTPIVFLAGLGRSGSTLLERLLGALPGWWSMGEVLHIWERGIKSNETCGCGAPFLSCPMWQEIGEKAFGGWKELDVDRTIALHRSVERDRYIPLLWQPRLSANFSARLADYNQVLCRLYDATRAVTGASVLVDAGKHVTASLVLRQNPAVDLRVIQNLRDSRGVAFSFAKTKPRPSASSTTMMYRMPPVETALRYVAYNSLISMVFGSERLVLRYEDLVAEPSQTVADVCEWVTGTACDVPSQSGQAVELAESHGVSGNPMRARTGLTTLTLDEEWREEMPLRQKLLVTAITAPSLLRSGYGLGTGPAPRR